MKIVINPESLHSELDLLIRDLTIMFSSYETDKLKNHFKEDIQWTLVGDETIIGRDIFIEALEMMDENHIIELTIQKIISSENNGAVNGIMVTENGGSYGFADFYEFTDTNPPLVKSIISYVIPLD